MAGICLVDLMLIALTTKRHIQSMFDLKPEEHIEMLAIMQKAKRVFTVFYSEAYRSEEERYDVKSMMVLLRKAWQYTV